MPLYVELESSCGKCGRTGYLAEREMWFLLSGGCMGATQGCPLLDFR